MKLLIVFSVAVICTVLARPNEQYTNKYDNIDLDSIFKSERLLTNYLNCLMDRGRCTPEGTELKANLPDALKNECAKCSEGQKKSGEKVVNFLIKNRPEMWAELEAKYDPEGIYRQKYEKRIEDLKDKKE